MRDQIAEHITQDPARDNDEEYQKSLRMVQILLHGFPEAANDLCLQAAAEGISHTDLVLEILYLAAGRWGMLEPRESEEIKKNGK